MNVAIDALEAVTDFGEREFTTPDLAERAALSYSTAHKTLHAFLERGIVRCRVDGATYPKARRWRRVKALARPPRRKR